MPIRLAQGAAPLSPLGATRLLPASGFLGRLDKARPVGHRPGHHTARPAAAAASSVGPVCAQEGEVSRAGRGARCHRATRAGWPLLMDRLGRCVWSTSGLLAGIVSPEFAPEANTGDKVMRHTTPQTGDRQLVLGGQKSPRPPTPGPPGRQHIFLPLAEPAGYPRCARCWGHRRTGPTPWSPSGPASQGHRSSRCRS